MGNHQHSSPLLQGESAPLHELISRILAVDVSAQKGGSYLLPTAGTLQSLNQKLVNQPLLDFVNSVLRGIGQVIFVNNPISGFLILLALFIQSTWVGTMGLVGVLVSTITAVILKLDRDTIRNGIFGYNGLLVGVALATLGDTQLGAGAWGWSVVVIMGAALTTVMMQTFGVWWAKTVNTPPLSLPFCMTTLVCWLLVTWLPQPWLQLTTAVETSTDVGLTGGQLLTALTIGVGQVFFASKFLSGLLILLAVALCTPLGALVGLLGGSLGIVAGLVAGLLVGIAPNTIYIGLWGYNAVLCAIAIGGVFYAPNVRSIGIGAIAALVAALLGGIISPWLTPLGLPDLAIPFCLVTIGCFIALQRSLPSLVPVALHAITSPEEHRQRYQIARNIITNFRQQLAAALANQRNFYMFDQASIAVKGDLRYLFNRIDIDQNAALSTHELATYLKQAGQVSSAADLAYLFSCMDQDGSGTIDFAEFGELMLRHRRLMANYTEFVTYFLPIDANDDDAISLDEMNVAMVSVGEPPLSREETNFLMQKTQGQPMTWNRFIEMLLVT